MTKDEALSALKLAISNETGVAVVEIGDGDTFFDLGLDSVTSIFVMEAVEKSCQIELQPMSFWDYPTVEQFASHIHSLRANG